MERELTEAEVRALIERFARRRRTPEEVERQRRIEVALRKTAKRILREEK